MPILENSEYRRPRMLFNRHLETILPGLFRNVKGVAYQRNRIDTPDGDFLDLDWIKQGYKRLVIISHGLEGDSGRPYVRGMAKTCASNNWDVLAWNYRGCGGHVNHKPIFYHSGASYDLESVVRHVVGLSEYDEIVLIGYSLGGNMTLKYLGEESSEKFPEVKAAVVFSVPLDLAGCSSQIDKPYNILYSRRFLSSLKKKAKIKKDLLENIVDLKGLNKVKSMYDFDNHFTAPVHGFVNAEDYYERSSSRQFVDKISIETLVVNAVNDPFLSDSCLDESLFVDLGNVYFEKPLHGGHCGFSQTNENGQYWSEKRALQFINKSLKCNG